MRPSFVLQDTLRIYNQHLTRTTIREAECGIYQEGS